MRLVRVMCGTAMMRAVWAMCVMCVLVPVLAGCLSADGPRTLSVTPGQYPQAFDAAVDAARDHGFRPLVLDRTTGIIETDTRHAGTLLEPWRLDNDGIEQAAANTLVRTRRRVRVEFTPAGWVPPPVTGEGTLQGAALPGSRTDLERFDLQAWSGPIEARVWVYLESSSQPGINLSSYSGTLSSRYQETRGVDPSAPSDGSTRFRSVWNPVGRDEAYERTIGLAISDALSRYGTSQVAANAAVQP
jgi:hypothetical protein